jgi:cytochrome P450
MHAQRDEPSKPSWCHDRLDSVLPPEIEAPYFDEILDAWILSRYADILTAFRSPSLSPASFNRPTSSDTTNDESPLKMRQETLDALSPTPLRAWREKLAPEAYALADSLPLDQAVDLMAAYARPLCLSLAAMVTEIELPDARGLCEKARQISAAAAEPTDPALDSLANSASAELESHFHSAIMTLRAPGFVALSQTMPCILGNAWFALLQHPLQWTLLRQQPALIEQALEELLRYAGLVRFLCRVATDDVDINGSFIRKGERMILRIVAANRDPERFMQPDQVDVMRRGGGHLALGSGPHSCVGASLIRMAAVTISQPLLKRFSSAKIAQTVDWRGGSCFRAPSSLWVLLSEKES